MYHPDFQLNEQTQKRRSAEPPRTKHRRYRSYTKNTRSNYGVKSESPARNRHRRGNSALTDTRAPLKTFRIDVYAESEAGDDLQSDNGRYASLTKGRENEAEARINRIRKRFHKKLAHGSNSDRNKNWYVQSV